MKIKELKQEEIINVAGGSTDTGAVGSAIGSIVGAAVGVSLVISDVKNWVVGHGNSQAQIWHSDINRKFGGATRAKYTGLLFVCTAAGSFVGWKIGQSVEGLSKVINKALS